MPTKHNKKHYQAAPVRRVAIMLTGKNFLRYRDEEEIALAEKGDTLFFPCSDALNGVHVGAYDRTGFAGYFKVDVYDGREWRPVILQSLFPGREHYFSKKECSIDTFNLCADIVTRLKGREVVRTYREHYGLEDADA